MKINLSPKRFWLLGFLIGLWFLVLLVPAFRLLFGVQLFGSPRMQLSALPSREFFTNFWEGEAQRFPGNVDVLWQAAKEYPARDEVEDEYSDEMDAPITAPPMPAPMPGNGNLPSAVVPKPKADPRLPQSMVFLGQLLGDLNEEKLRRLDLLIARFPNNADFIASRLRLTLGWMQKDRTGGELSDGNLQQNKAAGIASPERTKNKPNYTPQDLNKAIALAQRGGKLEPDNGFFDWMLCSFLLYGWRDEQAWTALEAAAKKTRFDEHIFAEQSSEQKALSAIYNRPLLLEEKLQIYSDSFVYSQGSQYRELARIISWQSVKALRKGDHQKALRIAAALARTSMHQRENARTYIDGLVAIATESIAWKSVTYDAISRRSFRNKNPASNNLSSFQVYATQHGHPEMAAEAARSYAAAAKFRASASTAVNSGNILTGLPFWYFILISLSWLAGVLLLLLLPLALLLPMVLWAFGRNARVRRVLGLEAASADKLNAEEIPKAREIWNGALACGGVRALATAASAAIIVGLACAAFMIGSGQSDSLVEIIKDFWNSLDINNSSYGGIDGIYFLLSPGHAPETHWRWAIALVPLLFGVLFAAWRATDWQKKQNDESVFSARTFFQSLLQGHAFRSPSGARDDLDVTAAFLKLCDWFGMLILIGLWFWLANVEYDLDAPVWLIPSTLGAIVCGVLLWEKIAIWRRRPRRRATVRYGLRLFRRSLLAWLVLGSALYFAALLISIPLRHRVETKLDSLIELGEVGFARKNPPKNTSLRKPAPAVF